VDGSCSTWADPVPTEWCSSEEYGAWISASDDKDDG
jgi:hypothetical protein